MSEGDDVRVLEFVIEVLYCGPIFFGGGGDGRSEVGVRIGGRNGWIGSKRIDFAL